jgi:hypothetical protein
MTPIDLVHSALVLGQEKNPIGFGVKVILTLYLINNMTTQTA